MVRSSQSGHLQHGTGTTTSSSKLSTTLFIIVILVLVVISNFFQEQSWTNTFNTFTMSTTLTTNAPTTMTKMEPTGLFHSSLIYDKTIPWDPNAPRLWLEWERDHNDWNQQNGTTTKTTAAVAAGKRREYQTRLKQPPAMVLLTSFRWNQPDQEVGLKLGRHVRETELVTGVVNHPWFHPTFWTRVEETTNVTALQEVLNTTFSETRFYVFLDVHTLFDSQYPIYGGHIQNYDTRNGRPNRRSETKLPKDTGAILRFLESRLFELVPKERIRLMIYNGDGWGPPNDHRSRVNGTTADLPISVASYSALISRSNARWDQGLPPPAPKPAPLSPSQVNAVQTCAAENQRRFFATYTGNGRSGKNGQFHKFHGGARFSYFEINDDVEVFAVNPYKEEAWNKSALHGWSYEDILRESVFGVAPRGDNKYSLRFTEVLSAGAILVVHADDWMWPFRPELFDWNECAIILPEKDAGPNTLEILRNISVVERCQRRKRCYEIYKEYIETPEGVIRGLVEGLEAAATRPEGPLPMQGVRCDAFNYSFDCNMQR